MKKREIWEVLEMKKLRTGISTLIMLVLIGLFSIVASAAAPSGPSVTKTYGDKSVTLSWPAVSGAVSYNVYWDGTTTPVNQTELSYERTGLTIGKVYTYAIEAVNATAEVSTKASGTAVVHFRISVTENDATITWPAITGADSYDVYWNGATTPENQIGTSYAKNDLAEGIYTILVKSVSGGTATALPSYTIKIKTPVADSSTVTANHPGPGINVGNKNNIGEESTHRTHGNFQNNTNSCSNCHSTHNAQEGEYLMMKSSEYDLCMACHDGTMGFYNVEIASGAGIFNDDGHSSSSMHNVDTGLNINSAPGAFTNTSTSELQCSSCHNPHGSVNDRLLSETVIGRSYAYNYTTTGSGSSLAYVKGAVMTSGTKSITLDLVPDTDPAYSEINSLPGNGLKVYKSNGPKTDIDRLNFSNYCSVCHDDYLAKRTEGKPSQTSFTHTTNSHKAGRNCASCHYSHGTDITTLKDSAGKTIADLKVEDPTKWGNGVAEEYMKNVSGSGSSAIKKFTNMAVCFSCHASSLGANSTTSGTGFNTAGKPAK
jgi:predicted CXXCH cytochrome family protein